MQRRIEKWAGWMKDLSAKGHIKDPGHPLERKGKLVTGAEGMVTDGPFAEAKDIVGGYTIVEARDINQAVELTSGCPILDFGGFVEVRPVMHLG